MGSAVRKSASTHASAGSAAGGIPAAPTPSPCHVHSEKKPLVVVPLTATTAATTPSAAPQNTAEECVPPQGTRRLFVVPPPKHNNTSSSLGSGAPSTLTQIHIRGNLLQPNAAGTSNEEARDDPLNHPLSPSSYASARRSSISSLHHPPQQQKLPEMAPLLESSVHALDRDVLPLTKQTAAVPSQTTKSCGSCSDFSLYSAESNTQERPDASVSQMSKESMQTAVVAAIRTVSKPIALSLMPPDKTQASAAAAAAAAHTSPLPTTPRRAFACRLPTKLSSLAAINKETQFPANGTPTPSTATAPAISLTLASVLLDVSFNGRALASDSATATSELERIGTRLHKLQQDPVFVQHLSQNHAVGSGAHCAPGPLMPFTLPALSSPPSISASGAISLPLDGTALPLAGTAASCALRTPFATSTAQSGATSYYAETVKFVQFLQDMQRSREAERVGFTWFRTEALQASIRYTSGSGEARDGNPTSASSVSPARPQRNSVQHYSPTARVRSPSSISVSSADYNRSQDGKRRHTTLLRMRDRTSPSLVHWTPYESEECEPMTHIIPAAVCSCSCPSSAATVPHDTDSSRGDATPPEEGLQKKGYWPFCRPSTGSSTLTGDQNLSLHANTPPADASLNVTASTDVMLPPVAATKVMTVPDFPDFPRDEEEKMSPVMSSNPLTTPAADSAGLQLSSSTATSSQSAFADSWPCCPVHVSYHPTSICVVHNWDKNAEATETPLPPTRRRLLVPGQVDVPANVPAAARHSATPLSATAVDRHAPRQGREVSHSSSSSSHSNSSNTSSRRAIIDVHVPHRQQLAKKALEENNLFFEAISRRHAKQQHPQPSPPQVLLPPPQQLQPLSPPSTPKSSNMKSL